MSKSDKRQYNYKYFVRQITENVFFAKYFVARKMIHGVESYNLLTHHKKIVIQRHVEQFGDDYVCANNE